MSKVYEWCICNQIRFYFNKILSNKQCGFCRGYNVQHCLIALIEKCEKSVDNGGAFGLLLTDLSKALDCFSHELLIAKLDAYGFDKKSLILVHCYLSNCKQRVKFTFFSVLGVRFYLRVPQGLIPEPLLFNTFICDMFYSIVDFEIENYGDDSTAFSVKLGGRSVVDGLEISSLILFTWLKNNYMKANTDKNHRLLSNKNNLTVNIDGNVLESEDNQV